MNGAVLAVGTELLGSDRTDTNSLWLAEVFRGYGCGLIAKAVVGDDETMIARQLQELTEVADIVVVTGGLGPTSDDRTREAIASLTGEPLELDESILANIEARSRRFARRMPAANRRQALVPRGALPLKNKNGTAPGLRLRHEGAEVFVLPGVPGEMKALVDAQVRPWLAEHGNADSAPETVELRVACLPESAVEEKLEPLTGEIGHQRMTLLASMGQVLVRIRDDRADPKPLVERARQARHLLDDAVFTDRGLELEAVVGELLSARGQTLSTAESCTGGLLGSRLTATPGSSAYYVGGAVSYSNALKTSLLGVSPSLIEDQGAVSEVVARRMASGARERFETTFALSITGIAGPGGGTDAKPVGTVHFALAFDGGTEHLHRVFPPGRERVRRLAAQSALEMLRRRLLDLGPLSGIPYYSADVTGHVSATVETGH